MGLNPQLSEDLVTFIEEIFNEKLHFFCSGFTHQENFEDYQQEIHSYFT